VKPFVFPDGQSRWLHRVNTGGGDTRIEEIDLPEKRTGAEPAEEHLALLGEATDVHDSVADDVEGGYGRSFLDDTFATFDFANDEEGGESAEFCIGEIAKDGNGAQQIELHARHLTGWCTGRARAVPGGWKRRIDGRFVAFKVNALNFMATIRDDARMRAEAERLADIFTVLQRIFILNLSKELARGNVSFPQYFLLGFLTHQKQLTMTEIAQKMGHTTAARKTTAAKFSSRRQPPGAPSSARSVRT